MMCLFFNLISTCPSYYGSIVRLVSALLSGLGFIQPSKRFPFRRSAVLMRERSARRLKGLVT